MRRIAAVLVVTVVAGFAATVGCAAVLHDDPCHADLTCPSDDGSYAWTEMVSMWTGYGFYCFDPASPKYNAAYDTHVVQYNNRTYVCHSAGFVLTVDFAPPVTSCDRCLWAQSPTARTFFRTPRAEPA